VGGGVKVLRTAPAFPSLGFEVVLQEDDILCLLLERDVVLWLQMVLEVAQREPREAVVEEDVFEVFCEEGSGGCYRSGEILESALRVAEEARFGDFISEE
jgi:hypothetical protein